MPKTPFQVNEEIRQMIKKAIGLNTITPEQAEKFRDASSKICDFFEPENEEELKILAEDISKRLKKLKLKNDERFYSGWPFPSPEKVSYYKIIQK